MDEQTRTRRHSAHVVSHVPGRIRIRLHPRSRQPGVMRRIKDSLAAQEGFHDVAINATTGSVRFNYDERQYDLSSLRRVLEDVDVIVSDYAPCIKAADETAKRREQRRPDLPGSYPGPQRMALERYGHANRPQDYSAPRFSYCRPMVHSPKRLHDRKDPGWTLSF